MTTKQKLIIEAVNEYTIAHSEYEAEIFEEGMYEMELINERLRILELFS
tara:strand:- start:1635 stop:1781 length:147 start_codon:yes stop_codon:yes gene_type:complete